MMAGLNEAKIIGYLGADPELRYTQDQTPVAQIRVATTRKWRQKGVEQVQEETTWHRVTLWSKLAERCNEYLKKGSLVYVSGRIRNFEYEDKEGNKRYGSEIVGRDVQFLDRPGGGGRGPGHPADRGGAPPPEGFGPEEVDDDIPF